MIHGRTHLSGGAILAALLALAALVAPAAARVAHPRTWYVRAVARSGGTGSRRAPFRLLAAAQRASRPGDRIVVLPSPPSAPPLDGGIALKPRQTLVGAGPSVVGRRRPAALPRIENTTDAESGDAVRLASGATVRNLVIGPANRGGIYGSDVAGVRVRDNDLSATNTSCTTGFVVQPFVLPTMAPGVGAPFSSGLANGWAAVMVDESHTRTQVTIEGNRIHDAACADGIDVRASGTSRVTARVGGNAVTRLREGSSQQSVLAIGMQTTGTATLVARVTRNAESWIGSATLGDEGDADSEGLFANSAGRSLLVEHADHNTFAHGLGHLSANCFEAAASNGGPTMHVSLARSTCEDVVGDILEADNLSRDATLTFDVDHVRAAHSTFVGSEAFHQAEPGDDGDCMLEAASGARSVTSVRITHSELTDCVADGLGVVSNVVDGAGASVERLGFDVVDSRIADNRQSNVRVASVTPIDHLEGRIARTDLSGSSAGTPVILENLDTTHGTQAHLDFGGGSCIDGGAALDVQDVGFDLSARGDWWGRPGGPAPGRVVAAGGTVDTGGALARAPAGTC